MSGRCCHRCGAGPGGTPAAVHPEDAGATLLELLVTLGLMSVVMAMITAGMVQMYSTVNRNEELSIVQAQLHVVFQRLDREIRYASGIRQPGQGQAGGGSWYVEYSVLTAGVEDCVQLRLPTAGGRFEHRNQRGAGAVSGWRQLAANVAAGARFSLEPATTDRYAHQQLTISLTSQPRAGVSAGNRPVEYTFTAMNSSIETPSGVCPDLDRP
jgi:hypothetical protein